MSGPKVKNHILSKTAVKYNATRKITCRSLAQDYQPAPPVRLKVHLQHRYSRTQQKKTLRQVQQLFDVKVHAVEYRETSCAVLNNQRTKTWTSIQYWETGCKICPNGWKISLKIKRTKECHHQWIHPQALLVNLIRNLSEEWYRARTELRNMQGDQNYKGACSRGTSCGYSVDTIIQCRTKSSQEKKKVYEHFSAVGKAESHLYWQFFGIWQSLWRIILGSLYIHASLFRKRYSRKSSTQNQGRNFCSAVAMKFGWQVVDWFPGM